jgi:hypothetical protein
MQYRTIYSDIHFSLEYAATKYNMGYTSNGESMADLWLAFSNFWRKGLYY